MYDLVRDITELIISAGPLMAVIFAIVILAAVLWSLANVMRQGFGVITTIYNQSSRQLRMTTKAVIRSSKDNVDGLLKISTVIESMTATLVKLEGASKSNHQEIKERLKEVKETVSNLEADARSALAPLIAKVDELFVLLNEMNNNSDVDDRIDKLTSEMREGLASLEDNIVKKFIELVVPATRHNRHEEQTTKPIPMEEAQDG